MTNDAIDEIFERLRREVAGAGGIDEQLPAGGVTPLALLSRQEAERWWAVTAERPYLYRPGALGRLRGWLLLPLKAALRRGMRWYVEPLAVDQRHFNSALLRVVDELTAELSRLRAELAQLRERLGPP